MSLLLVAFLTGTLALRTEFGLGGDYTSQQFRTISGFDTLNYEWEESDTTDIETEGRSFLALDLDFDGGPLTIDAGNTASVSTLSARDQLDLRLDYEPAPGLRLRGSNDAEYRSYHDWFPGFRDTTWTGKDYFSNSAEAECEWEPLDRLEFTIGDRVELMRYASPDSYSYDYLLNRLELDGRVGLGGFSSLDVGYDWSRRDAVGLPERDYVEHAFTLGLDQYFDSGLSLGLDNDLVRRRYGAAAGSGVEERARFSAGYDFGGVALDVEDEAGWTWYDSTTTVYANLFENSLEPTVEFRPGNELSIRAGPRLAVARGLAGPGEEDYNELSVLGGLDFFRLSGFWVSAEDRVGWRRYLEADTTWQSNYAFNELSLFLSWTVLPVGRQGLVLEGMASVSPEWHADRSDNFSVALFSLELKYGF